MALPITNRAVDCRVLESTPTFGMLEGMTLIKFTSILLLIIFLHGCSSGQSGRPCEWFAILQCPGDNTPEGNFRFAQPSQTGQTNLNPALIDTETKVGIEVLNFRKYWDANLITGTGRTGSAFSSTNTDGTFFGNIPIETFEDRNRRQNKNRPFKTRKRILAYSVKALSLVPLENKRDLFSLRLGANGRYNQDTGRISPGFGGGITIWRFFLGAAGFKDDFRDKVSQTTNRYRVSSYTASFMHQYLSVAYSFVYTHANNANKLKILSASSVLGPFIFSYGRRWEIQHEPAEMFERRAPPAVSEKTVRHFAGVQLNFFDRIFVGGYWNYYLLKGLTATVTLFLL